MTRSTRASIAISLLLVVPQVALTEAPTRTAATGAAATQATTTQAETPEIAGPSDASRQSEVRAALKNAAEAVREGELGTARAHYLSAVEASGDASLRAQIGLARIALHQQQFNEAQSAGSRVWEMATQDGERAIGAHLLGQTALGRARRLGKQPSQRQLHLEEADEQLRLAVNLSDGHLHPAWFELAATLQLLGEAEEAHRIFEGYRTREPEKANTGEPKALSDCLDALQQEDWDVALVPTDWSPYGLELPQKVETPLPLFDGTDPGVVEVEVLIREDGAVACAQVVNDSTAHSGAVVAQALLGWRYRPALLVGEPVTVRFVQALKIGG